MVRYPGSRRNGLHRHSLLRHLGWRGGPACARTGSVELYPELATKADVLCSRIIRNHPLPDGNKRVGCVALLELIARNDATHLVPAVPRGGVQPAWRSGAGG